MAGSRAHSIRTLILVMVTIVITGILVARSYYGNINRSVDPRVLHARELYSHYDQFARAGDFPGIFLLLDSIEDIYRKTAHYSRSFEVGVVENNRAAALLTLALYGDSIPRGRNPFHELPPDSVVNMAMNHALNAIQIYETWPLRYKGFSGEEIRKILEPGFVDGLNPGDPSMVERIISNRVGEIQSALRENDRRLSVCHTNLGVIYRLQGNHREAVGQYEKAIALWDRNLEAENNLNRILNKPLKKRNILQKIFPPERGVSH
ncbi:MAG: tetratricopeptide repeat protein [Bacteroidota bacterium]